MNVIGQGLEGGDVEAVDALFQRALSARMMSWLMMEMKAERVLPEPVGEQMRTFLPCRMSGTACLWGGVKRPSAEEKEASHQSRTTG